GPSGRRVRLCVDTERQRNTERDRNEHGSCGPRRHGTRRCSRRRRQRVTPTRAHLPAARLSTGRMRGVRPSLTSLDRRILGLAVPALGALIVEPLYNVTDTAIVGHLGRGPLGGLALAAAVLNLLGWTAAFLQMATT